MSIGIFMFRPPHHCLNVLFVNFFFPCLLPNISKQSSHVKISCLPVREIFIIYKTSVSYKDFSYCGNMIFSHVKISMTSYDCAIKFTN